MKTLAQSRRLVFALLCASGLAVSALPAHALALDADGSVAHVGKADPYTDGAVKTADPYTDGAFGKRDTFSEGAHVADRRDAFGQGA